MNIVRALACGLLWAMAIGPMEPQDGTFLSLFDSHEYRYTGGGYRDEPFRYRLFVPSHGQITGKWPLIVWLHGHGEGGNDNFVHLRWLDRLILQAPWRRERFPYFVFAVQCGDGNREWTTNDPKQDNMVDVAAAIVERLLRDYPIDPDRVLLAGVSSGGTGCWKFAVRHPDLFAAVTPFSSGGTDDPRLDRVVGIPIWAFHSSDDTKPPVEVVRRTVTDLENLGGTVQLTEIATGDHDCWTAAFARYGVLDWLLSQKRGQSSWWNGPETFSRRQELRHFLEDWQWWQILAQIGIPAVFIGIVLTALHLRRKGLPAG